MANLKSSFLTDKLLSHTQHYIDNLPFSYDSLINPQNLPGLKNPAVECRQTIKNLCVLNHRYDGLGSNFPQEIERYQKDLESDTHLLLCGFLPDESHHLYAEHQEYWHGLATQVQKDNWLHPVIHHIPLTVQYSNDITFKEDYFYFCNKHSFGDLKFQSVITITFITVYGQGFVKSSAISYTTKL